MGRWGELSFVQWVFEKRLCILEKRRCVVFLIKVSGRYACFSKVPESCKQSVYFFPRFHKFGSNLSLFHETANAEFVPTTETQIDVSHTL
jgi:hypothetical protein